MKSETLLTGLVPSSDESTPALPLEVFLQMLGMKFQVAAGADATDAPLPRPYVKRFDMAVEQGCRFSCGE